MSHFLSYIRSAPRVFHDAFPAYCLSAAVLVCVLELAIVRWDIPNPFASAAGHLPVAVLLLAMAAAPAVALGLFLYGRDRGCRQPPRLLGRLFLWGALSGPFVGFAEHVGGLLLGMEGPPSPLQAFLYYFIVVGGLEEFAKYTVARRLAYATPHFRQVYDGVLFCVASTLGFATLENILYILTAGDAAAGVALGRALTAVPSHVANGVVMGYALGRAHAAKGTTREGQWIRFGFLGAVVLHGAYDFMLVLPGAAALLFLPVMLLGWVLAWKMIRRALAVSPFSRCAGCGGGVPRAASYCPRCGTDRKLRIVCKDCGAPVSKWSRRCQKCATRVRLPRHLHPGQIGALFPGRAFNACPFCGEGIPTRTRFCLHCGRLVRHAPVRVGQM